MTTAVLSKPYWRWWRHARHRLAGRRPGAIAKPWNGLILVAILIAFDAYTKSQLVTQDWAWHTQPATWLLQPFFALLITVPFFLIALTRPAAVFALAGTLGNTLSELRFDTIANPVQIQTANETVAFNLADVYLALGPILAMYAVVVAFWRIVNPGGTP